MFTFALLHICYLKRAVLKLKASECLQTAASTTKGSIFVKKKKIKCFRDVFNHKKWENSPSCISIIFIS